MYRRGDLLAIETVTYLYELIDSTDRAFYVGVTDRPEMRLREHIQQCGGCASLKEQSAKEAPRMRIVSVFRDRADALAAEIAAIKANPQLLNYVGTWRGREHATRYGQIGGAWVKMHLKPRIFEKVKKAPV